MLPAIPTHPPLEAVIPLVTNTVSSPHSRRAYSRALRAFLKFVGTQPFTRPVVMAWRVSLTQQGATPATVNQALSAVRSLAREAAACGYLDEGTAAQVCLVPNLPHAGVRLGNWLEPDQVRALLATPDQNTTAGLRDFVLLGLLFGCGLRRSEVVAIRTDQIVQRGSRTVILDLIGKGQRVRTCVIPRWLESPLERWIQIAGPGLLLRSLEHGEIGESLTDSAAYFIVRKYADQCSLDFAPHDLRRTFALQSLEGGANVEAIRQALGHASLATTTRYVSAGLTLKNPACDYLMGGK